MIQELWGSFPRLLEKNINELLDTAEPNPIKAFMLYKRCQQESLWNDDFRKFSKHLEDFYSRPKAQRRKSDFDRFLDRPMDSDIYSGFHLCFRTAHVSEKAVDDVASWAHNLMRVAKKMTSAVISFEIMSKTLKAIVNPLPHEKSENIEFEDFCSAWEKTVFKTHGTKHSTELKGLVAELRWANAQLKDAEANPRKHVSVSTIYLTQTEIDWTLAVQAAALEGSPVPKFPLSKGPQKQLLIDLERVVRLYHMVETTRLPELGHQRERIRNTILDRCEALLGDRTAA